MPARIIPVLPLITIMFLASVRRAALRAPRARTLTTSWPRRAALPAQPTVLLSSPSPEYLEQEEIDVDLLPPQEAHIILTDRAAEVRLLPATVSHSNVPPAIALHIRPADQSRRRTANSGRVRRLPWLSVQNGARENPGTGRLVSPHDLPDARGNLCARALQSL